MNKPIKPNITIPESFARNGVKTDFDNDLIAEGFDNLRPDVLAGDNLNKFIDDTYQGLNYGMAAADAINLINEGETLTVVDGKLTSGASGGGLEIGDIGFTQMAIDETKGKRRILNGQLIIQDQYVQLANIIKNSVALNPDLACTESEWQTAVTMSTFGICYKFVIDDDAGTIRLPKYPNYFIGGLANIAPVVGNGMALGLTVGTKNYSLSCVDKADTSGANLYKSGYGLNVGDQTDGGSIDTSGTSYAVGVTTDTTKSGIEAQIKQEKIVGTYFIQVATGAETKDEIENEHLLNIPFFIGYSQYFKNAPYNLSWAVGGSTLTRAVHPAYYDALLIELNADIEVGTTQNNYTKRGLPVKLATDSDITDYDFVVNTADETFRLPLLNGSEDLVGDVLIGQEVQASGTLYTAPVNGWFRIGGTSTAAYGYVQIYQNTRLGIISQAPAQNSQVDACLPVSKGQQVYVVYKNVNITAFNFLYAKGNGSLYFYVGEVAQNTNLVNAGRIEEIKANKTDVDGQWVKKQVVLINQDTTTSEMTFDLSSYLPNDGYDYNVLVEANCYTGTTSGDYITAYISSDVTNGIGICRARTRTSSSVETLGNALIPVGIGRTFTLNGSTSSSFKGSRTIVLHGYRRIGTNV